MAKSNIKKIISVLAAVAIISSQMIFTAPMISAAPINGTLPTETTGLALESFSTERTNQETKTMSFDALRGSFIITFDMTVENPVATPSGNNSGLKLTFNGGGSKVGGALQLGAYDEAKNSHPVIWVLSSNQTLGNIEVGKKYTYEFSFDHVGDGKGVTAGVVVTDNETGTKVVNSQGLGYRNYSDTSDKEAGTRNLSFTQAVLDLMARDADTPASVVIENPKVEISKPSEINVTVKDADFKKANEDGTEAIVTEDISLKVSGNEAIYVESMGKDFALANDIDGYDVVYSVPADTKGISVEGNTLKITSRAPAGKSTFTLSAALKDWPDMTADMEVSLDKEPAAPDVLITETADTLEIADVKGNSVNATSAKNPYDLVNELKLDKGDDYIKIDWEAFEKSDGSWVATDIVDVETGKYTMKKDFDGLLKLTATISSKEDASLEPKTKDFYISISNPEEQLKLDVAELEKYMEDYERVKSSFTLPKTGSYASKISWTSNNPSVVSAKGAVTRQNSGKTVTLTATLENGREKKEVLFDVYVQAKSTTGSSGGGGGSTSPRSGGDSYQFYTPVTTTLVNPVQQPDMHATPNLTNQPQDLGTVNSNTATFNDLGGVEWAAEAINKLAEKGIINGKAQNTFAPNDNITRAEFAKILVNALNLTDPNATADALSDVKAGEWYYSSVASAFTKGVIKGRDDGQFGVNDSISRQDMAVLLYRAAQAANYTLPVLAEEVNFADAAQIDDYAKEAVTALQRAKIINGVSETEFAPKATATRAAAAKMIYGIYNLQ